MMTTQDHLSRRLPCYPATTRIAQDECHPPERYRLGVQGIEPLYAQSVTSPNMDSMASDRVRKRPHRRHSAQGIAASLNEILCLVWLSLVGDLVDGSVHLVHETVLVVPDVVLYLPRRGPPAFQGTVVFPWRKALTTQRLAPASLTRATSMLRQAAYACPCGFTNQNVVPSDGHAPRSGALIVRCSGALSS